MNSKLAALLCLCFTLGLHAETSLKQGTEKPNVVLFYIDDFGWGDLSINDGQVPTPNMDRILTQGVRCDNYTTHCVCSPSRGGLLTGRHYINVNVGPRTEGELDPEETTMAETFKAAGYATGAFGKWHNGSPTCYGPNPTKQMKSKYKLGHGVNSHGFDRFVGFYGGGGSFFDRYANVYLHKTWYHDLVNMPDEEGYTTDLITKYALEFIDKNKDQPFFCYIPHEAMHNPLHAKYEDLLKVSDKVLNGTPLLTKKEYDDYFLTRNKWQKMPKKQRGIVRAAMLINLDESIGKVLSYLEKNKLMEKTIILFAADNGATPDGNNLPLRGGKHTMYEGGIHVPAAIWSKGHGIDGGHQYTGDFGYLDVYPTLCSLAGISRLPGRPLDGRDLSKDLLAKKSNAPTTHHWVWTNRGVTREGRWKLIYNLEKMELYDLATDQSEKTNLAKSEPKTVTRLKALHEKWLSDTNCSPSYAIPRVSQPISAKPEGEVLEFYAEQTKPVKHPKRGFRCVFALGMRQNESHRVSPGDVIEYDICVAPDGRDDGFVYTPSYGWSPIVTGSMTGYDQFGRLQVKGPAPQKGKGVWEHRVIGIGNNCPGRMPFNIISLHAKKPGTYHFYLDNVIVRKEDGTVIPMWQSGKDTFDRWDEEPFLMTPNHPSFQNVKIKAVPLAEIPK